MKTIEKEGKTIYQCDVCGSEYESEDDAKDCEADRKSTRLNSSHSV